MDEWYIQEPLDHKRMGTPLNTLFNQLNYRQPITTPEDNWEMGAAADDNEAYEIEQERAE